MRHNYKKIVLLFVLLGVAVLSYGQQDVELNASKRPFEEIDYSYNFSNKAGSSTITLVSVTSTNMKTGASSTNNIIAASPTPAVSPGTTKVVFRVRGGVTGDSHLCIIRAIKDETSERLEGRIKLDIGDKIR